MHGGFKALNHGQFTQEKKKKKKSRFTGVPYDEMTPEQEYEHSMALGKHFAKISREPLTKQDTGDAWNERQNRLAAARDAVKIMMKATMKYNRSKRNGT